MTFIKPAACALALNISLLASFSAFSNGADQNSEEITNTPLKAEQLEKTIQQALDTFYTPGMSVSVVYQDEVIFSGGFGMANIETQQAVTPDTYFRLASTSKAFTASALAILVDQEKLAWNDLVIDHLPHFRLQDSYATRHFTIGDLLTHKSGLTGGAGDSMIWPEPSGFSRDEVVHNLRYLTPEFAFRESYAYSNVMYITAGEVVEAVSGMSFDAFVDTHIFTALDMKCYTGDMPDEAVADSAMAYAHSDARGIYPVPRNAIYGEAQMSAAAGGMVCSSSQMQKWLKGLLKPENLPFSPQQLDKMWQPHTILSVSDIDNEWDNTFFRTYGLGWRLANYDGYKHISHTGTLSGYQAFVALLPQLELGVVILNNGSNYGARGAVMQSILKAFTRGNNPNPAEDWVAKFVDYQDEQEQAYLARFEAPQKLSVSTLPSNKIIGTYTDQWYGDLVVTREKDVLRIASSRMKNLKGRLLPYQDSTYKIEWDNKNAAADAFMHFELDISREVLSARLHPFSTRISTTHEWRDMHFIKQ